jgi:hypothetical protein
VSGEQREIDEGEDVVDRVVMLGDAERPAQDRLVGRGIRVGELADRVRRDARLAFRVLERVELDLRAVGLEVRGGPVDELAVREAGVDDLAPDGVRQRDVTADVEAEPDVRPLGRARPARVDREQPGAVVDAAEEVVEEDRMRLSGVGAPEDDQIGVLDLTI